MKIVEKKLNVLTLVPDDKKDAVMEISKTWDKYFEVNHMIDKPENIKNHTESSIDILFLWHEDSHVFELNFYKTFQERTNHFKYVNLKDKEEPSDFNVYKLLVDDILYFDNHKLAVWKSIAILRRYWRTYSKPTTIIYKDIIADFIDNFVSVAGEEVELTKKEMQLLKFFMFRIGEFTSKKIIFKEIWGFDDDTSRTLDQMIFKLKKKIGPKYFHSSRAEGFKFE